MITQCLSSCICVFMCCLASGSGPAGGPVTAMCCSVVVGILFCLRVRHRLPVRCCSARCGLAASGSIYSGSLRRSGRNASSSVLAGAAVALTGATSRQPGRVAEGALAADSTPQSCQQGWQEEATFFQDQAGWQVTIRALAVASVVV